MRVTRGAAAHPRDRARGRAVLRQRRAPDRAGRAARRHGRRRRARLSSRHRRSTRPARCCSSSIARRLAARGTNGPARRRDAAGAARRDAGRARHVPRRRVATVVPRRRPGGRMGGARDPRSAGRTRARTRRRRCAAFPLLEGLERRRARAHRRVTSCGATYADGEVLFQENDPGDRLCLLARGAVEISIVVPGGAARAHRDDGRRLAVRRGGAAATDGPRSATAQAVETTVVYELTRTALDEIARNRARDRDPAHDESRAAACRIRMRETNEILRAARRLARLTPVTTPVPGRRAPR